MKNEYKNQVFIYGLPAGGDSLTSQSLARRKCLLMGPSLSLYRSVPGYYCIVSLNLAKLFFLLLLLLLFFLFLTISSPHRIGSSIFVLFHSCWPSVFQQSIVDTSPLLTGLYSDDERVFFFFSNSFLTESA
jgi:hypothetical protein